MDRIRIGYPAGYLRFFWIRIGFGYLYSKKIGSGYLFDFYNEIFLRLMQDVTNDGASVFLTMVFIFTKIKMILSVCAALITFNDKFVLLYRKFIFGEVEVVSCSYIAGVLLCLFC